MSDHDECTESYNDCVRSRQERVQRAVEANPDASTRVIADMAGVSNTAVSNYKRKTVNGFTTKNDVKLRDLYDHHDIELGFRPTVRTIERALERCTKAELAYVLDKLFPAFKEILERRANA